ncbi:tRNA glutamyl-Q(34) synthetase GluQRS [Prosthecobacter dejongeii]|uniref:Glutamyl-Q tRNA(Asp) synthetase n=1 Tax=Prosthecobacter dejongeii TaxID=48465 RepID=A0A7W7YNH1_9BACT|nr:tRNA glutamyl-Q(34) synthetase GluQRS [Prosthecobacter dejongeii]MBB5039421.1 glutamyl-Q tRNA(Asp) synthetase [Prosthecobacter dejongeii]
MNTVTRFAPSPTGWLHLGHAYAAIFAEQKARQNLGRFLIRLEDIDGTRSRPEYETALFDDLQWLGLTWERPVLRQSDHAADYRLALDELARQELLYPCFCTRREIQEEIAQAPRAPHGPDGPLYPGTCRHLSHRESQSLIESGQPYALRLDIEKATYRIGHSLQWEDLGRGLQTANPALFGDVVLARKDTPASYHLAVVVDDARQGITLVTRGEDLFEATHLHRLLQELLHLPVPTWHHHRLVTDELGKRLAKRDHARSLRTLREEGWTPQKVRRVLNLEESAS